MKQKLLALLLALSLLLGLALPAAAQTDDVIHPSVVIPGVFQSEVKYLNDDGTEKLNSKGEPYEAPFFLDSSDIVKDALLQALLPVGAMLVTQQDKENKAAEAVADVLGKALAGKVASDAQGHFINSIQATKYPTNLAGLSEHDRAFALDAIPLYDYAAQAGMENLYFFSYASFGNIYEIANELYDLIQTAKAEHGGTTVNLAPVSQGGSLFGALMQIYKDKGRALSEDVHRVCLIVPAANGTALLGDIYRYGLLDDDDALYGYMFPSLLEEDWLGYLIPLLLRILPNADVNSILDTAVHKLVEDYLEYSTCMWALLPSEDYPALREMYLSDPEDAEIRRQTDWYYQAQCDYKQNILDAKADGVEFFDIVDYNKALYPICDSWDKVNADGVIDLASTSLGATSAPVGQTLPTDYTQQNTYCADPSHQHIDADRIVDASTGILCDSTFYFKGQHHEATARNGVVIALATRILYDNSFRDVYTDPAFPQFNFGRNSSSMQNRIRWAENLDTSSATDEQKANLAAALDAAKQADASTVVPTEEYEAASDALQAAITAITDADKAPDTKTDAKTTLLDVLKKIFKILQAFLLKLSQGRGFSELRGR